MDSDDKKILKVLIPVMIFSIYGIVRLFSDIISLFI